MDVLYHVFAAFSIQKRKISVIFAVKSFRFDAILLKFVKNKITFEKMLVY